jgi:hypothetical protein
MDQILKKEFQNSLLMYKLSNIPSIEESISGITDFLEVQCIINEENSYSIESAKKILSMESDELNNEGIESEDDKILNRLVLSLSEIKNRNLNSAGRYPFQPGRNSVKSKDVDDVSKIIYTYLLLATRNNMRDEKVQEGIDATLLFEELSEYVIKSYFGDNSKAMIIGTSSSGTFSGKINQLLENLYIKGEFKDPIGSTGKQNDGKVDIVVWKPFSDKRDPMLMGMGQCKTGTHWENFLTQMRPSSFFGSYSTGTPCVDPIRLFFITDSISGIGNEKWEERARDGGIIFDRCRLMEFLPSNLPEELIDKIRRWNSCILQKYRN